MDNEIIAKILGTTSKKVVKMKKQKKHEYMFNVIESKYENNISELTSFVNTYFHRKINNSPIKWVGGKKQILNTLLIEFPEKIDNYYEPFIGGAIVFNNVVANKKYINDINRELINFYKCLKNKKNKIFEEVDKHRNNLLIFGEKYYYEIRTWDREKFWNKRTPYERAGRFLFLNKSSFNGLWRENSKGQNNSPWNKKTDVTYYQKEIINKFVANLKKTTICNMDFENFLKNAKKGDFIYLDPPYDIEKNINDFTSYSSVGFDRFEQERLNKLLIKLDSIGVKWLMSNSNTKWIRENYKHFNLKIISTRVSINSDKMNRKKINNEVLIRNY